jgi:hypothetical protein
MEEVKNFLNEFLKAEAAASYALVKPNLGDFNNKLAIMNRFCVEELQNKLGMIPRTELWDDDLYEEWKDAAPIEPRNLFKISHYKNEIYGDVYVAYLSPKNPNGRIFRYGECLFITKIEDELRGIKIYGFGDKMRIKKKFETTSGIEDISFETLKNPVEIERYIPPQHDNDALEHYLMDV